MYEKMVRNMGGRIKHTEAGFFHCSSEVLGAFYYSCLNGIIMGYTAFVKLH